MYKLLIAEDEVWISALIRTIIQKGLPDVQVIGEAENGRMALEMIQTYSPDIVLLDINMPVFNGLQVIEQAKNADFCGKVIIISGHEDFSYAQQALRLGVENYLLKPIDDDKLCDAVTNCLYKIKHDQDMADHFSKSKSLLETHFLKKLLSEQGPLTIEACNENYGLQFKEGNFLCAAAKFSARAAFPNTGFDEIVSEFYQHVKQELGPLCTETLHFSQGSFFYLFLGYRPDQSLAVHQKLYSLLDALIRDCAGQDFFVNVGISDECIEFSQLRTIYQNAKNTLAANMKPSASNFATYRPDFWNQKSGAVPKALSHKDMVALQRAFNSSMPKVVSQWFHQLLDYYIITNHIGNTEMLFLLDYSNMLLDAILGAAHNLPIQVYVDRSLFFGQFDTCTTIDDLKSRVDTALNDIFVQIETQRTTSDQVIKRATEYINAHLSDAISLEGVAQYVHLSPSYFSEYFKMKMEINFKDYVLQCRIKKATTLLQRSSQQIQDVAVNCGYADVKHFCKVFKKSVGLTPSEFRRIYG